MIRRNLPLGFNPREWLLIAQTEHARMSGELAEHWGNGVFSPVVCRPNESDPANLAIRREVLAAITYHDDGWADWEGATALESEQGQPLDFMEMPLTDALAIWQASIQSARCIGPLAGAMVAGHFLALLDGSRQAREPAAIEWRQTVEAQRAAWLREWGEANPRLHTSEVADRALRWLQLFDWLSLWLCCKCEAESADFEAGNQPLEIDLPYAREPRVAFRAALAAAEVRVSAMPWPFDVLELSVTANGYSVLARQFRSTNGLLVARQPIVLKWRLAPR